MELGPARQPGARLAREVPTSGDPKPETRGETAQFRGYIPGQPRPAEVERPLRWKPLIQALMLMIVSLWGLFGLLGVLVGVILARTLI